MIEAKNTVVTQLLGRVPIAANSHVRGYSKYYAELLDADLHTRKSSASTL